MICSICNDDIVSCKQLCNDDVFRCIGELLTISPICQIEHIPLVTNIILESKEITEDLLFMLRSAAIIAESPSDIQMLIEPFLSKDTESNEFKLLLSILESIVGDKHTSDEFPSLLDYNASSKLESFDTSFDSFLSLIAKLIGIYIPMFDKAHLAVEFTLRIMARLTKKIEVKTQLSLQEAVKCVSISFNSQSLLETATLLCENLSLTSVTAFLILFNDRESELLQCVQPFVKNILSQQESKASVVFDANETLAKAATSLLDLLLLIIFNLILFTKKIYSYHYQYKRKRVETPKILQLFS